MPSLFDGSLRAYTHLQLQRIEVSIVWWKQVDQSVIFLTCQQSCETSRLSSPNPIIGLPSCCRWVVWQLYWIALTITNQEIWWTSKLCHRCLDITESPSVCCCYSAFWIQRQTYKPVVRFHGSCKGTIIILALSCTWVTGYLQSHTGANLAEAFEQMLDEFGISEKVHTLLRKDRDKISYLTI